MGDEPGKTQSWIWSAIGGLLPLYVLASSASMGLALGALYLLSYSSAASVSLLAPARFGRRPIILLAMSAAAIMASIGSSLVRLVSPVMFEVYGPIFFLVPFVYPVMKAACTTRTDDGSDGLIEDLIRGAGNAGGIVVFGLMRELLAIGAIAGSSASGSARFLPVAAHPAGAFMLIAAFMASFKAIASFARKNNV